MRDISGMPGAATAVKPYGEGGGGEEMRLELLAQPEPATGPGASQATRIKLPRLIKPHGRPAADGMNRRQVETRVQGSLGVIQSMGNVGNYLHVGTGPMRGCGYRRARQN